ncbi:uncharacterized protein LOC115929377 [Strongylocentrotus purpuratus]|uniref:Uncharacterized protein n=1 Tax=Strongylocentrotus purpuratus TaxID=7668 RepID=A0A7M7PQP7_STRPU|nr:uncharacterized protein LOC115929377 [Strongylocentrotus purpuratus]
MSVTNMAKTLKKTENSLTDVLSVMAIVNDDMIYSFPSSEEELLPSQSYTQSRQKRSSSGSSSDGTPPERKRRKKTSEHSAENSDAAIEQKCQGISEISLKKLVEPEKDLQRPRTRKEVMEAKQFVMKAATHFQSSHVLPVLAVDGPSGTAYQLLGGVCYALAAKDLVDDERYEHLSRGWRCRVYQNLDKVEALRVASLHRCGQPAVDKPCLQEEVAVCRSILYDDNNLDVEDEPCTMTASTRRKCSLALGKNGSFNALRALEPTFQLASYSNRCYRKATLLFDATRESTGKDLKQCCFMKLQGLSEEERYSLLLEATLSLNVKKMKADADELKAMKSLKSVFAKGVGAKTWEEAIERYPTFTSEAALEPYVGKKYTKGNIPEVFLEHISRAKRDMDMNADDIPALMIQELEEDIQLSSTPSATTRIFLTKDITAISKVVSQHTRHDVHILHIVQSPVGDIQDVNHNVCMQYGIVESRRRGAGTSQLYMPSRSDFYKYAVEHFTSIDEVVLDVGDGLLARVAAECGRNGRMVEETTLSSTEIEAMMGAADSEEILDADLVLSMDQTCSIP